MKYRATISIEFDAFDHPQLRERTTEIAEGIKVIEARFGHVVLVVKERRPRRLPRAPAPQQVWSGR